MILMIMDLEKEIIAIKERNQKVERDKTWENSFFRKTSIVLITYIVSIIFLWFIGVKQPYFNALLPALGFYLSTLSLDFCKKIWIKYVYDKNGV